MLSLEISSSKHKRLFDQQQQSPSSTPPVLDGSGSPAANQDSPKEPKLISSSPSVTISSSNNPARRLFDPHLQGLSNSNKRRSTWRNLLTPSYKTRSDEFHRLFCDKIPKNERLIADYACALHREILIQGRVYISLNYIAFYSNLFSWITKLVVKLRDVSEIYKANTARIIPNAIQIITTGGEKHVFASFVARDKSYIMMLRIWQNNLMSERMSDQEIKNLVHFSYGKDLGMNENEELKINSLEPVELDDGGETAASVPLADGTGASAASSTPGPPPEPPKLELASSPTLSSSLSSGSSTFSSSSPLLSPSTRSNQLSPLSAGQTNLGANSNSASGSPGSNCSPTAGPALDQKPPSPPSAPPNSPNSLPTSTQPKGGPRSASHEQAQQRERSAQQEVVDRNNNQEELELTRLSSSKSDSMMLLPMHSVLRRSKTTPKFERPQKKGREKERGRSKKSQPNQKGHTRSNSFDCPAAGKSAESSLISDNLVSNNLDEQEAAGSYSPAVVLDTPERLRPAQPPPSPEVSDEPGSLNTSQADEFGGLNARVDGEDLVELTTSCDCELHAGQLIADKEFDINVDTLFTLIFTNSKFMRSYMIRRGMLDAFVSNWKKASGSNASTLSRAEAEQPEMVRIEQVRQLNYSIMLNHLLAKQVDIEERQNICQARPGVYVLKSQTINSGVPYGETFTVDISYCLTRNGDMNKSRMLVHGFVNFKKEKQNWKLAMVKSMIEKQSLNGINEHIADLSACVRDYIQDTIQKAQELRLPPGSSPSLSPVVDQLELLQVPQQEQADRASLKSTKSKFSAHFTPLGSRKSSFSSDSNDSTSPLVGHKKNPSVTTLYSIIGGGGGGGGGGGDHQSAQSGPLPAGAGERAGSSTGAQKWTQFLIILLLSALLILAACNLSLIRRLDSLESSLKELKCHELVSVLQDRRSVVGAGAGV